MTAPRDPRAAQARRIGLVLVATMGLWLIVLNMGAEYNWPPRYILLVDLSALAGFFWTLVATYRLWRSGQS